MAFSDKSPFSQHLDLPHAQPDIEEQSTGAANEEGSGVLRWLSHEIFKQDCLDRKLERHHITGQLSLSIFQPEC